MGSQSTGTRTPFAIGDLPVGRVLDEALDLVKHHGWPAFVVGILPLLPLVITADLLQMWLFEEELVTVPSLYLAYFGWTALYGGLLSAPLSAGMIYLLATGYLGSRVGVREGYLHAAACWLKIAPIYMLLYALVYAGINFFCYVPGILLIAATYLHLPAMSLERAGPIAAFGRNFGLIRGRIGPILLVVVAEFSIQAGLHSAAYGLGSLYVGTAIARLITAPVSLYFTAVAVVIYFSARSRHEAIDLQLLADAIGEETAEEDARL